MIRVLKYLSWGIIILVLLLSAFVAASFYLGSESAGVKSDAPTEVVAPTGSGAASTGVVTPEVGMPEVSTPEVHTELK